MECFVCRDVLYTCSSSANCSAIYGGTERSLLPCRIENGGNRSLRYQATTKHENDKASASYCAQVRMLV